MRTDLNPRYKILRDIVNTRPVTHITGHSLGAATVGQFLANNPHLPVTAHLHGWPTVGQNTDTRITSFAGHFDPVAVGDFSAQRRWMLYPHSYSGSDAHF